MKRIRGVMLPTGPVTRGTQKAVGPAKAILWLALLANHNFVQVLTVILYSYLSISTELNVHGHLEYPHNLTTITN